MSLEKLCYMLGFFALIAAVGIYRQYLKEKRHKKETRDEEDFIP